MPTWKWFLVLLVLSIFWVAERSLFPIFLVATAVFVVVEHIRRRKTTTPQRPVPDLPVAGIQRLPPVPVIQHVRPRELVHHDEILFRDDGKGHPLLLGDENRRARKSEQDRRTARYTHDVSSSSANR